MSRSTIFKQVLGIAKLSKSPAFQEISQARKFHNSATTAVVQVASATVPQSLIESRLEKYYSKDSSDKISDMIMPRDQLQKSSRELLAFLTQESKSSPEAKSMLEMIEKFKRREAEVAILNNPMPSVDASLGEKYLNPIDIAQDSQIDEQTILKIIREQALNINLIQQIYYLCGWRFFDSAKTAADSASAYILHDAHHQSLHCDGVTANQTLQITANSLFATNSISDPKISTTFVSVADIIAKLDPETVKILMKPIFSQFGSSETFAVIRPASHIASTAESGTNIEIFYPGGATVTKQERAFVIEDGEKKNYYEEGVKALKAFGSAMNNVKKNESLSLLLEAENQRPKQIVSFNNTKLLHARESYFRYGTNAANQFVTTRSRQLIAVTATIDNEPKGGRNA